MQRWWTIRQTGLWHGRHGTSVSVSITAARGLSGAQCHGLVGPKIPIDGVLMSKESMFYDASKAKDQLGFDPGPLDAAIREAIRWFAENGYLSKRAR